MEVIQGSKAGSMALGAALGRLLDEIPQKFLLATVLKGPAFRVPALIDEALDMVELEDWSRTAGWNPDVLGLSSSSLLEDELNVMFLMSVSASGVGRSLTSPISMRLMGCSGW